MNKVTSIVIKLIIIVSILTVATCIFINKKISEKPALSDEVTSSTSVTTTKVTETSASKAQSTQTSAETKASETSTSTTSTENTEASQTSQVTVATTEKITETSQVREVMYYLNTYRHKFHRPDCPSVQEMNPQNRQAFYGTREQAIADGYDPCKNCKP